MDRPQHGYSAATSGEEAKGKRAMASEEGGVGGESELYGALWLLSEAVTCAQKRDARIIFGDTFILLFKLLESKLISVLEEGIWKLDPKIASSG